MSVPSGCIRDWCLAPAAWDSGCISHHSIKHIPLTTPAALKRLKPHWYLSACGHREKLGLQSLSLKNKALSHEPWAWQPKTVDSVLFTQNTHSRGDLAQEEAVTSWQMPPRAAAVPPTHSAQCAVHIPCYHQWRIRKFGVSFSFFFFLLKLISNFSLSRQIHRHSLIFEIKIKIFTQTTFITFKYFTARTWWKIWLFFTIQTPKATPSLSSIVTHFKNGGLKTYIEIFHFPLHNTQ